MKVTNVLEDVCLSLAQNIDIGTQMLPCTSTVNNLYWIVHYSEKGQ